MKENGYVKRRVVQSRGKEAEEAEEAKEEEEEEAEEDGQTRGVAGSSWSYCLSGVVARGSADRGDIARREGDRWGDGGCQRMRGSEGGKEPWWLKERSTAAEEEAEWQKKEKRRRRRTRRLQRARMERERDRGTRRG